MKAGMRHLLLGAGLGGALLLLVFGEAAPDGDIAEAVERAPRPGRAAPLAAQAAPDAGILSLVPRETLAGADDEPFGGGGEGASGPFARRDWNPPPPPDRPAPPPPPPSAPPLPFIFLGKSVGAGVWEVYLARGDRTYVVRDNTVIDGSWRVDAIAPPVLSLTYLPLNQVQQLNIGVFD